MDPYQQRELIKVNNDLGDAAPGAKQIHFLPRVSRAAPFGKCKCNEILSHFGPTTSRDPFQSGGCSTRVGWIINIWRLIIIMAISMQINGVKVSTGSGNRIISVHFVVVIIIAAKLQRATTRRNRATERRCWLLMLQHPLPTGEYWTLRRAAVRSHSHRPRGSVSNLCTKLLYLSTKPLQAQDRNSDHLVTTRMSVGENMISVTHKDTVGICFICSAGNTKHG